MVYINQNMVYINKKQHKNNKFTAKIPYDHMSVVKSVVVDDKTYFLISQYNKKKLGKNGYHKSTGFNFFYDVNLFLKYNFRQ